jgi:hypothetical protein
MMAILPDLKKGADPGTLSDPVKEIKERLIANFMALAEEAHTRGVPSLGSIMADMANSIEADDIDGIGKAYDDLNDALAAHHS